MSVTWGGGMEKCHECQAFLIGNEKLGQRCNKCLDKAVANHAIAGDPKVLAALQRAAQQPGVPVYFVNSNGQRASCVVPKEQCNGR